VFLEQLINGITLGSIYAIVALGYTLVFGVLDIINMAHGEIFMFGAFVGLLIVSKAGAPLPVAFLGAIVVTAASRRYASMRTSSRLTYSRGRCASSGTSMTTSVSSTLGSPFSSSTASVTSSQ